MARRFGWHSGTVTARKIVQNVSGVTNTMSGNLTILGNLTVQGTFTFGDAATDNLSVTGYYSQTYSGTAKDGMSITASGNLGAGKNAVKITVSGSGYSSTSHGLHVAMTGDGNAGAYGVYINATGANVEGLKVDAGTSQFDELVTCSSGVAVDGTADYALDVDGATVNNAEVRFTNDVVIMENAGAPTSGTSGTGNGFAGKGSICIDTTNGDLYVNIATKTSPDWKKVTRAS